MLATPTAIAQNVNGLRVVCQDNRLANLCDEGIITAMINYNPLGGYGRRNPTELLSIAAVLKRIFGSLTVAEFSRFIDSREDISVGFLALLQDGAASFEVGLGNFLDFESGFENGVFFVSRDRYNGVWDFLARSGVNVPPSIRNMQLYDINLFGEPGLWIKPVYLGTDGSSIRS